ncbi:MAG: YceI family protein [Salibacteraceae bacterium]
MKLFVYTCLVLLFPFVSVSQSIDSEKSNVEFEIGGMLWTTVEGSIKGMKGNISFDKTNLATASFNVCIDPNTIYTDNEERDAHLKNEDFFNVPKYPKICFVSTSVSQKGDRFIAKGKLTILEVTKEIEIPFAYSAGKLSGKIMINRFDYGLAATSYDGTGMVDDEVTISINCILK